MLRSRSPSSARAAPAPRSNTEALTKSNRIGAGNRIFPSFADRTVRQETYNHDYRAQAKNTNSARRIALCPAEPSPGRVVALEILDRDKVVGDVLSQSLRYSIDRDPIEIEPRHDESDLAHAGPQNARNPIAGQPILIGGPDKHKFLGIAQELARASLLDFMENAFVCLAELSAGRIAFPNHADARHLDVIFDNTMESRIA